DTKLQVLLRRTNEIVEKKAQYIFDSYVVSPEVEMMGYDKIPLSEVDWVLEEMSLFMSMGSRGTPNNIREVITDYLSDPFSLYTHANESDTNQDPTKYLKRRLEEKNQGDKLKNMVKIAKLAYQIQSHIDYDASRTDKSWLFREPIDEVIETEMANKEIDIRDLTPAIAGHLKTRAKNRDAVKWGTSEEDLNEAAMELADEIVKFIEEYWDGTIPDDEQIRNATNAFMFIYTELCHNEGVWKYD
ncbi:MAG: hypothetical protein ACOCSL_05885, partial [Thermoplasmatota archaeon]